MATTNNRYILTGTFINLLPEAIYLLSFTNMLCVGDIAMHIHCTYQLSWSLVLTLLLPEASCYVYGVLLTLLCTYIPTFMATTANIR